MTNHDGRSSKLEDALDEDVLSEVRTEIDRSADDLQRLTERVDQQTAVVERLEILVTEAFQLVTVTAIVLDENGLLAAVSRGARDLYRGLSPDAVGQPVTSVLPVQLADGIAAAGRASKEPPGPSRSRGRRSGESTRWVTIPGAKVIALPGGWAFAVLGE